MLPLRTLPFMTLVAALMQGAVLISHAQAHEMDGIDHMHLTDGVVQIIEPIPGVASAREERPAQTKKHAAAAQPSGVMSLIVQVVLIGSAVVLLVVALRVGLIPRGRRRAKTTKMPPQPPTPIPPA